MRYSLAVKTIEGGPTAVAVKAPNPAMQRTGDVPLDEGRPWAGDLYETGPVTDPEAAFGRFQLGDEDTEAWLDKNEDGSLVGWVREGADVYRYSDAEAWALDVDGAGMQLTHSQATGAADPGLEAEPGIDPTATTDAEEAALNPDPEAEAEEAAVADQHIGEDEGPEAFADEDDPATDEADPTEAVEDPTDLPGDTEGEFDNPFAELTDADDDEDAEAPADDDEDLAAEPDGDADDTEVAEEDAEDDETDLDDEPGDYEPTGDEDLDDEDEEDPDEPEPDDEDDDADEDPDDKKKRAKPLFEKKHMPGKHNQQSHGDWADNIPNAPKKAGIDSGPKGSAPEKAKRKAKLTPETVTRMSDEDLEAVTESDDLYDMDTLLAAAKELDSRRPLDAIVRSDVGHTKPGSPERAAVFDSVIPDQWARFAALGGKKPKRNKRQEIQAAYYEYIAAQQQRAQDYLRGGSAVNDAGRKKGITEDMFFNGQVSSRQFPKYASEDLQRFFGESGEQRMTFSEFAAEFYPSYQKAKQKLGSRYLSEHG